MDIQNSHFRPIRVVNLLTKKKKKKIPDRETTSCVSSNTEGHMVILMITEIKKGAFAFRGPTHNIVC